MSTAVSTGAVASADGTVIAYDRRGDGPSLVLVLGAFNDRSTHDDFATELARYFTVFSYDRRGRGGSGDAKTYTVDKEIADLAAVVAQAPAKPALFGYSSGAILALAATAGGLDVSALALYEPPPVAAANRAVAARLDRLVSTDRRGDAVELFQTEVIGMPESVVAQIRNAPFRPGLDAMAHTLAYDTTITDGTLIPAALAASVTVPALVQLGEASPAAMRDAATAVAAAIPNSSLQVLDAQTHHIVPAVVAPALHDFVTRHPG